VHASAAKHLPPGYLSELLRLERQRQFRRSARGKRERMRSRRQFRHLRAGAALRVAEDEFGDFVTSPVWSTASLEDRMGKIDEYLSDNAGLVGVSGGRREVLESTLPLRTRDADGVTRPVDLSLEADGDALRPVNPLAHISVAARGSGVVTFEDAGFSVTQDGDPSGRGRPTSGKAFFANSGVDADTLIEPQPAGAEFATLLRSPASPNALRLRFDLARQLSEASPEESTSLYEEGSPTTRGTGRGSPEEQARPALRARRIRERRRPPAAISEAARRSTRLVARRSKSRRDAGRAAGPSPARVSAALRSAGRATVMATFAHSRRRCTTTFCHARPLCD
jgi:hypothetical protein